MAGNCSRPVPAASALAQAMLHSAQWADNMHPTGVHWHRLPTDREQ